MFLHDKQTGLKRQNEERKWRLAAIQNFTKSPILLRSFSLVILVIVISSGGATPLEYIALWFIINEM